MRAFAEAGRPVDVLVNNAGALALPLSTSPDGVELHLATNHLGHFALTNLLLPRLTDRVVVVARPRTGTATSTSTTWTGPAPALPPYAAYADSKLANLLFMAELQRRLTAAGSTLRVTGAHPGSTATGITGSTGNPVKTFVGKHGIKLVGMPAWQGALPTLYAATMDVPGNTYVGPHRLREMNGWPTGVGRSQRALDPDLAKELWAESERLSGVRLPALAPVGGSSEGDASISTSSLGAVAPRRRVWTTPWAARSLIALTVASSTVPKTV